ncbi:MULTISPECIES: hypothetical protein [Streptomyces]|jgi:hypothetical protein|uniref:Lipoprotein n=1 Tax=Streptomyces radiopugnans TaxID=403935 RepID=A0A1H9GMU6_9ACTN|nr:hypothetical protein [Streptomyces radiopugnans]SEQ51268.1 hypothetical protein SAMN05216481_10993 [Streptomyces radiopugnans]
MGKKAVRAALPAALLFGALSLSGCGDGGTGEEISGTLARNSAAESGELAFDQAGHEIDGDLTCTDEGTGENLRVTCEGTTVDGGEARMVADAGSDPRIETEGGVTFEGFTIVGTVDGEQVFRENCIGVGC